MSHPAHRRPPSWQVWLMAARPATLLAGAVPVLVGTSLAAADGVMRGGVAVVALLGAILIQIGTNFFNDYADFKKGADTAARLGPARVTQCGLLTPAQVGIATVATFGLAVLCGILLLVEAGWPVVVIGAASIAAGVAYTGGPFPLGYHGLGEIFVFIFFGVVAVCGTYYVQALELSESAMWASMPVGCLACAILAVNNLRDRHTDGPVGKRTLAVRFGERFARREYGGLLLLAYAIPVLACVAGVGGLGWLLPLASAPLAVACVRTVREADGRALNPLLGRTARVETIFGLLLALGVLL